MPQSWKQGQVQLIPKKDKPRTIGDARPITLLNADYKIYSHMLAWWLRDSMTTLCSPSQRTFIASRDIKNNIVLANSLVDANNDGIIMMLDWAKAYDLVDHGHVENVLFCMGYDGIGLQRLMSTAKGLHTACDWVTVSVRAIQQRKRCGSGMSTRASSLCPCH